MKYRLVLENRTKAQVGDSKRTTEVQCFQSEIQEFGRIVNQSDLSDFLIIDVSQGLPSK